MSITDAEPAVDAAGYAPEPDLAQRLSYGLDVIGAPELAGLIATAGLAAVYDQLQRTRQALGENVHTELAVGLQIAHLTDEARRWKRRWAGAVAQARHEHARADNLQSIVGLHDLSDRMGEQHRAKLQEKHDQLLAVLRDVLASFKENGHPGYAALRSTWVEVQRVEAWRAVLSPTPERPWWEQLKDLCAENEQLRGRLAAERLANDELLAERADLELAISELQGAAQRSSADGRRSGIADSIKALEGAHLCRECGSAPELILEHLLETTTAEHAAEGSER